MHDSNRIPIPWNQKWEEFRWRIFPVLCFVLTLVGCGWLWRQQSQMTPVALGEVHSDVAELRSPVDGVLLPTEGEASEPWPLFALFDQGATAVRIKPAGGGEPVDVAAPFAGQVTQVHLRPGQAVRAGEPVLRLASPQAEYIVCHVPERLQHAAEPGADVAVRQRGNGSAWTNTQVVSVGPAYEATPMHQAPEMSLTTLGLPIRIALPAGAELKPGSIVEVRFAGG